MNKIGKYEIVEELGRGSMGRVLKAHDPSLDRFVAIKVIDCAYGDQRQLLARFQREARTAAGLQHLNVVTVYDTGQTEQGAPYIVMEYLEGVALSSVIQQLSNRGQAVFPGQTARAVPMAERLALIAHVCDGLAHVHEHGIVHRDIKPANLMIVARQQVKILDFGVAHVGDSRMTMGGTVGTYLYMSPEQIGGSTQINPRSDVYSLGVVLYEFATLKAPYVAEGIGQLAWAIANEPVPPLAEALHWNPPGLDAVLARALAKKPEERCSAEEFGRQLRGIADVVARAEHDHYVSLIGATVVPGKPQPDSIPTIVAPREAEASSKPLAKDAYTEPPIWTASHAASSAASIDVTVVTQPQDIPARNLEVQSEAKPRRSWKKPAGIVAAIAVLSTVIIVATPLRETIFGTNSSTEKVAPPLPALDDEPMPIDPNSNEYVAAQQPLLMKAFKQPQDAAAQERLGSLYFGARQWSKAANYGDKALALKPDNVEVASWCGSAYSELGDIDTAIARWQSALTYDPNRASVLFKLGRAYAENKHDPAKALQYLEKLASVNPTYKSDQVQPLLTRTRAEAQLEQERQTAAQAPVKLDRPLAKAPVQRDIQQAKTPVQQENTAVPQNRVSTGSGEDPWAEMGRRVSQVADEMATEEQQRKAAAKAKKKKSGQGTQ